MKQDEIEEKKMNLLSFIPDLFSDFLYYNRKECDEVSVQDVDFLIKGGHLTKEELKQAFENSIEDVFK